MITPSVNLLVAEPQSDFFSCGCIGVGSMANVSADVDALVSSDSSRIRIKWLGCAKDLPASQDGIVTFPNHTADGSRRCVVDESIEEWFVLEVDVVLFELCPAWLFQFHGDKFETSVFEFGDDLSELTSLHSIRLDHNESPFSYLI